MKRKATLVRLGLAEPPRRMTKMRHCFGASLFVCLRAGPGVALRNRIHARWNRRVAGSTRLEQPSRRQGGRPVAGAAALAAVALFASGCLTKRGVDFGHWGRAPERIELVRVFRADPNVTLETGTRVLVLPPVGSIAPPDARQSMAHNIMREMQYAAPVHPFQLETAALPARYWREDNVADTDGRFDLEEVVRIGDLFTAPYVLCVHVRAWRPYAPQVLALHMTLVDVAGRRPVAELHASFNAAEQQVVVAADDWLQARRARKYDAQSLDILLRSPSEFSAFVTARCVQRLLEVLKGTAVTTDT
jgi:hypothetical protein